MQNVFKENAFRMGGIFYVEVNGIKSRSESTLADFTRQWTIWKLKRLPPGYAKDLNRGLSCISMSLWQCTKVHKFYIWQSLKILEEFDYLRKGLILLIESRWFILNW